MVIVAQSVHLITAAALVGIQVSTAKITRGTL